MTYADGQKIYVGDKVWLGGDSYGMVVAVIDDDEYTPEYNKDEWSYLRTGILVMSNVEGLVHIADEDTELELVKRRKGDSP